MFYEESAKIWDKINKAESILINIHKHPDYDSISSALAISNVLNKIGKKNKIVGCQKVNEHFLFLKGAENIEFIDYSTFDFKDFDLFIIPDTGSFDRVTGSKEISLPKNLEYVVIDHHKTNYFDQELKVLDERASATAEVLYGLFDDWKIDIDPTLATYLLAGILGDTVFLRYGEDSKKTLSVVAKLVEKGADKDFISENFYERYEFKTIKLLGVFLENMKKEKDFIWSAIPYETFEKYGKPDGVREMVADLFFRGIRGTDYGVAILEYEKGEISLSFRSKKEADVSQVARLFGGGGHKNAAGATVKGEFNKAVQSIVSKIMTMSKK
jgi:phosphoesterase RecJ-like protein